jgi:hypothetical protein
MPDQFPCPDCGTILRTASPLPPGSSAQCPQCGTVFKVPGAAPRRARPEPEEARESAPRGRSRPAPRDEEEERRPARRRKQASKKGGGGFVWLILVLMLGGIGLVSCVGLGIAIYAFGSSMGLTFLDSHDAVMRDQLRALDEMATIVETIRDQPSADAARPRLRALRPRMEALRKRADALGQPAPDVRDRLQAKYRSEVERVTGRLSGSMLRIIFVPGAREALAELGGPDQVNRPGLFPF